MAESETPTTAISVGAVVLAGGRARRLHGQDKGLILLCGEPLAAWVIRCLRPQVASLVLSANRNLEAYAALGRVVTDDIPGLPGPLAGIHAAAATLDCEWVLTAPCDAPFLPVDLVSRLRAGARQAGVDAVYAADDRRAHYTVLLLRRARAASIPAFLAAGGRRVQDWLFELQARPVLFRDDPYTFFNINTPADLAMAEAYAKTRMARPVQT
ncbi:MAG: molybdenum cofactor guanylyltransferase MobA [Thiobacillaceae bacterium]